MDFRFENDQEITVHYPPTTRHRNGRVRDGIIAARMQFGARREYRVLFDDDEADPLVPEQWIRPRAQTYLEV